MKVIESKTIFWAFIMLFAIAMWILIPWIVCTSTVRGVYGKVNWSYCAKVAF